MPPMDGQVTKPEEVSHLMYNILSHSRSLQQYLWSMGRSSVEYTRAGKMICTFLLLSFVKCILYHCGIKTPRANNTCKRSIVDS